MKCNIMEELETPVEEEEDDESLEETPEAVEAGADEV